MAKISTKIGFIGCGNMGEALLKGLLGKGIVSVNNVLTADSSPSRRRYLQRSYRIKTTPHNETVVKNCNIIILAVKPQDIDTVLKGIYKLLKNKLIISIAAGVSIKHIQKKLQKSKVVRAMPNTPALVGLGITAICKSRSASSKDYNAAKSIFEAVGHVVEVGEKHMDIVTATSGSGPAYFFLLIDAMVKAAVSGGLSKVIAQQLVARTALGASVLAMCSGKVTKELIAKVASKGGTTEAALKVFSKKRFEAMVKEAVKQAAKRSKRLSR